MRTHKGIDPWCCNRSKPTTGTRVVKLAAGSLVLHAVLCGGCEQSNDSANSIPYDNREVNQQINTKSNPKTPGDYKTLFRPVGSQELRQLKHNQHKGISLRAAWLELIDATTEPKRRKTVAPNRVQRFLGFVEGRLGVGIPESWEAALLRAKSTPHENPDPSDNEMFHFPRGDDLFYEATKTGFRAPSRISLEDRAGNLSLTVGNKSIDIPASLLKELTNGIRLRYDRSSGGVTALMSGGECYLAFHSVNSEPYKLVCLDLRTKQVRWKVDVETDYEGPSGGIDSYDFSGWFYHWVTLVEKNGVLFVFGVSWECAYIEAFHTKDGTNLFRFSTGY